MLNDWIFSFHDDVAAALNAGVRGDSLYSGVNFGRNNQLTNVLLVVVYSGKYDLVCNYFGGSNWVSNMNWRGQV